MERRDYIEKQIDQLGEVLRALFQKILKRKESHDLPTVSEIQEYLQEDLGLTMETLSELQVKEIVPFLIKEKGYSDTNLEQLATTIFLLTEGEIDLNRPNDYVDLLKVEFAILAYLSQTSTDYSLARHMRISSLKRLIVD